MYFLLKIGIYHCYVRLPEGNLHSKTWKETFALARQWMPMESDRLAEYETKSPGNPRSKKRGETEVSMLQKKSMENTCSCHATGVMNRRCKS